MLLTVLLGMPAGLTSLQILSIDLGTELAPAISLAYEPAERDIMLRPPRNIKRDRLVSRNLLMYAYVVMGVIESIGCLGACTSQMREKWGRGALSQCFPLILFLRTSLFLTMSLWFHLKNLDIWVYARQGLSLADLVFVDDNFAEDDDVFCGGNGHCLDLDQQKATLNQAAAAWYITLIVSQVFHLLNIKATHISIFSHNWSNPVTYLGIGLALSLSIVFVYVPGVQDVMGAAAVGVEGWVPPLVVGLAIFVLSELRARYLHNHPATGLARWLYW